MGQAKVQQTAECSRKNWSLGDMHLAFWTVMCHYKIQKGKEKKVSRYRFYSLNFTWDYREVFSNLATCIVTSNPSDQL